jgi:hypothetical protein
MPRYITLVVAVVLAICLGGCARVGHDRVDERVLQRKGWTRGGREHNALNADLERIHETERF